MTSEPTARSTPSPSVAGMPLRIVRSEGAVLLAVALAAYVTGLDEPLWRVPLLLFVPDLFIAGYLRSNRFGAVLYNLGHSYPAPALVGMIALSASNELWQGVALVWFAHIGMDRALGFGLKYDTDFRDTHLGRGR